MSDLVKRALQILGTATIETGKSYTSNLTAFVNDAKDVRSMITQSTTNVSDTYNRLKNTNLTKKIADWFYQNEQSSEQDAAEEFDSGMKTDDSGDESPSVSVDGEHRSRPLDTESMSDIFEKSTAAAFKIGRKQTEQSVINTSEIITTFNDRSSEIIASINNVNNTLIDIRKTLQDFTKAYSAVNSTVANNTEDKRSLYSNGQLSMARIFELSKESFLNDNTIVGGARMLGQLLSGSTPEALAQTGIEAVLNRIKLPGLDKTIGEAAKSLNETIGTAIQTGLSEMIGTDLFKSIFGDISKIDGGFDYSSVANKTYTTQRAQFDGMTRQSIVTIIPEMLAKINESLSGRAFHVDNTGHWQEGPRQDKFVEVTHAAFANSGIDYKAQQSISNNGMRSVGKQIPGEDVELAGKALTSMFVNYARAEGTSNLTVGMLKNMDTTDVVSDAANICASASKNGDLKYWVKVCQTVMLTISSSMGDGHRFVANVNQSLKNVSDRGMEFAKSGSVYSYQARAITKDMIAGEAVRMLSESGSAYDRKLQERNGTLIEPVNTDKKGKKKNKADTSTIDGRTEQAPKTRYTINEYVAAIYEILNRGINVRSMTARHGKDLYGPIPIGQSAIYKNADNEFAQLFISNAMKGGSDEKTFKGIIREGMQEATDSLLGKESGGSGRVGNVLNAVLGGGNPIGNIISLLGTQSISSLGKSALNGTLFSDIKENVGKAKEGLGKTFNQASEKLEGAIPGAIRYNENYQALGGIEGIVSKIGDKISEKINPYGLTSEDLKTFANEKIVGSKNKRVQKATAYTNAKLYAMDDITLTGSEMAMEGYNSDNKEDMQCLEFIKDLLGKQPMSTDTLDLALDFCKEFKDKSMRMLIEKRIGIIRKRLDGQLSMKSGVAPAIGSVSEEDFSAAQKLGQQNNTANAGKAKGKTVGDKVLNAIKGVGSIIGKIYKFLGEMFKSGVEDIYYGAKTMASGWKELYEKTLGRFFKFISPVVKGVATFTKKLVVGAVKVVGKLTKLAIKGVTGLVKLAAKGISWAVNGIGEFLKKSGGKLFENIGNGDGVLSRFAAGFTAGFREKNLAKAKAEDPLGADIDDNTKEIKETLGEIRDSLTGSEGSGANEIKKKGLFSKFGDLIGGLFGGGKSSKGNKSKNGPTGGDDLSIGDASKMSAKSKIKAADGKTDSTGEEGDVTEKRDLGIAGALGKMLGGPLQIVVGILKSVLSVVMGFTVVKELISDIKEIFSKSIEGLKPVFTELAGAVRTFLPAFKAVMDTIVESLKSILEPIVDITEPLLKTLIPCVVDVVKLISDILVPPIVWAVEKVAPLLLKFAQGISWVVEKISGGIYILAGGALKIISMLQSRLSQIVDGAGVVWETVKAVVKGDGDVSNIVEAGVEFASDQVRYRTRAEIGDSYIKLGEDMLKGKEKDVETVEEKDFKDSVDTTHVALTNDFGAGDVTTINNYSYTYGSGNVTNNQNSYGNYMNMGERGCGPVALADAFNRRNAGANLNPRTLAESMLTSGAYIPSRGTSVASMITTGNGLGMNLHAGGVDRRSLGTASPTNPVTVYGSGTGFGTRPGNGHYVNVIGTDRMGNAYVTNPLTGRTSRQNINALISNSKLGLYGSGDADDFMFDEGTNAMMANLKELTNRLTGIFSFDNEVDGSTEYEANRIKSSISEDDMKSIEENPEYQKALEGYQKAFKPKDGEDETSFLERIKKKFASTATAMKLIVKYGTPILNSIIEADKASLQAEADQDKAVSSAIQSQISGSTAVSDIGAEMAPYSPINYTSTNIKNAASGASPVHDFFSATNGRSLKAITRNGGWFNKRNNPNSEGVGSQGEPSDGIIIHFNGMKDGQAALIKAITGGTVTYVGKGGQTSINANGGLGNHVKWRDAAGMYHWYYHLGNIDSKISEGSIIEPGQLIGTIGTDIDKPTGYIESGVNGFGYTLSKVGPYGSTGDGTENPLTYWKFEEAGADGGYSSAGGSSDAERLWNILRARGLTPEQVGGIMGNIQAESGMRSNNVQDTYESSVGSDTAYSDNVSNGKYPRSRFISDQAGYGLAQWTASDRKGNLYDATVGKGKRVDDFEAQANLIYDEMPNIMSKIKSLSTLKAVSDYWLHEYERPADQSTNVENLRARYGQDWYNKFRNNTVQGNTQSVASQIAETSAMGKFRSTLSNVTAGAGYFTSDGGAVLYTDKYIPTVTTLNITGAAKSESPLNEFFSMMTGGRPDASKSSGLGATMWYGHYYTPNRCGVGSSGDTHGGIDINTDAKYGGDDEGSPLYATTGGVVKSAGYSPSAGNNIKWQDSAGYYHWYMHLKDLPLKHEKETIQGGTLLGYMGNTGNSDGAHLHYSIHYKEPAWSSDYTVNPLEYFHNYNPNAGKAAAMATGSGSNKGGITHYMSTISNAQPEVYSGIGPFKQLEPTYPATTPTGPSSIWDIDTWSNMTAQQRDGLFRDLAINHTKAVNKSASYSNEWAQGGTAADWEAMYNAYQTGTNQNIWDTESTLQQLAELHKVVGSGDVSSVNGGYIPPLDMDSLMDSASYDGRTSQSINLFNIKPQSKSTDEMLDKINNMTFNVRAKRVEDLLEKLITIVSEGKEKPSVGVGTADPDPFLFNNSIPPQIARLVKG